MQIMLIPAYGRKYETEAAILKGWQEGKDFKILQGPYCSIRDMGHLSQLADVIVLADLIYNVKVVLSV